MQSYQKLTLSKDLLPILIQFPRPGGLVAAAEKVNPKNTFIPDAKTSKSQEQLFHPPQVP